MKKLIVLVPVLALAGVPGSAGALTGDNPTDAGHTHRAKKDAKKKKPLYRVRVEHETNYTGITDCKRGPNDKYRLKETTTGTTKYTERGYYPGSTTRTGFREGLIKTESTDPGIPSDEIKVPRTVIETTFGPDSSAWKLNRRGTMFTYTADDAIGSPRKHRFRAPALAKSRKRTLTSTHKPPQATNGKCKSSIEQKVREEVTIKRIE